MDSNSWKKVSHKNLYYKWERRKWLDEIIAPMELSKNTWKQSNKRWAIAGLKCMDELAETYNKIEKIMLFEEEFKIIVKMIKEYDSYITSLARNYRGNILESYRWFKENVNQNWKESLSF